MKNLFYITVLLVVVSCSGVKDVQKSINTGNYEDAINLATKKLQRNKTKKGNQPYISLLKNAFAKAVEKDENRLAYLQKENNPEKIGEIYNLYTRLNNRQNKIKPLLPLRLIETNKEVKFNLVNYQDKLVENKAKLVDFLYKKAEKKLYSHNTNKLELRKVYNDFKYIHKLSPNYKNINSLLKETHYKGTDFVFVTIKNETRKVIPKRLEEDLLDFDTYRLNDFWTVYHNRKDRNINYDYELQLNFRRIDLSPERVNQKELVKEKELKETYYTKDSLGNKVKSSRLVKRTCRINEITQTKTCGITGNVKYIDTRNNQVLESFPLASSFTFSHTYGNYSGNRRVLDKRYLDIVNAKEVPFPSNEQMIFDTGRDVKNKLKEIITKNKFR